MQIGEKVMKVFVTGVGGQLGHDVVKELIKRGYEAVGSDIAAEINTPSGMDYVQMDITDAAVVRHVLNQVKPDAVVHCAAWTAVDLAEDDDKVELVRAINAQGTANIASVCKDLDCKMVYISTDYVFDGQGNTPWQPDCVNFKPLNVYGQTKLEGELAVKAMLEKYFIVRIAWVFGLNGKNFIKTMLTVGRKYDTIRVVNDQVGTPTYTLDLSCLLVDMIETEKYGVYHATNEGGFISWYEFACEIFRQAGYSTNVLPVTTAEYGMSKAARPFNSRLDKSKLVEAGFTPLPTWQDALARYLKEIEV
jgi:dTDP-4-dehydrorhamnose reductase